MRVSTIYQFIKHIYFLPYVLNIAFNFQNFMFIYPKVKLKLYSLGQGLC